MSGRIAWGILTPIVTIGVYENRRTTVSFADTSNYGHLQGEIVGRDIYKLQSLVALPPDVVFDIGANIGVFTHYARKLFPNAWVVAVEPHPENFAILKEYTPPEKTVLLHKAIGTGQVFRHPDVQSQDRSEVSAGESYFSTGFGYVPPTIDHHPVEVPAVMLDELYHTYVRPGQRLAIKIDCEGAENILFAHPPSVEVLQKADFLAMELHPFWSKDSLENDVTLAYHVQSLLRTTHRFDSETPYFYAWKKPDGESVGCREEFGQFLRERNLLGPAAEIGVCQGSFSRDILNWGVSRLYLVDPWKELSDAPCGITDEQHEKFYQDCLANIRGCEDRTTVLRMLSAEAAKTIPDGTLDFCYIDANHRYEGISVDLPTWWPKVRSGGILAGHDYLALGLGVNQAVTEFTEANNLTVHTVIDHVQDASFWITKP